MNQPINWSEIFARANEKPPEQEAEGNCADPNCRHALKNHIRGWCIEDFLESKPYCECGFAVSALRNDDNAERKLKESGENPQDSSSIFVIAGYL